MKISRSFFGLAAAALLFGPSVAFAQAVNAQTGTTYTVLNTDCDPAAKKLITFNNAAAVAVTLPQAGGALGFVGGCVITAVNIGLGTVTITPGTSTINGGTSLTLLPYSGVSIYNDSTPAAAGNYFAQSGGSGPAGTSSINFRNVLHNGGMAVQQRGTGTQTCAANAAITSAAYSADRWGCSANVGSGAGRAAAVTSALPTGFSGALNLFRTSGALTQPVCTMQAVSSADSTPLAGQTVTLSFYAKADAGLAADNGNVINSYVFTGTGADQGFGTMTASPAITPAWTGITSNLTKAHTITTSWARYTSTVAIPSTVTQVAVAICFTPTATGAGATDGFFLTGVQLEASPFATAFEFRPFAVEFAIAQRHYWQIADGASTVNYPSTCNVTTANTTVRCNYALPVVMRAVPTTTVGTATSFGILLTAGTAGTCTTLAASASSNTTQQIGLTCTTGGTIALGTGTMLIGAATGGTLSASADY